MRHNLTTVSNYAPSQSATFMRSRERYGDLSNMTFGFPLDVNGVTFQSSEGLYQALKFPHDPDFQQQIGAAPSGMETKRLSRTRAAVADWDDFRIDAMAVTLAFKLHQHPQRFTKALHETSKLSIVEKSYRDIFWGARPGPSGIVGANVLGKLLEDLRYHLVHASDPHTAAFTYARQFDDDHLLINSRCPTLPTPDPKENT